jgi:hypothetical protein
MGSLDFRTRYVDDAVQLEPEAPVSQLQSSLPAERWHEAGRSAARMSLAPITFDIDGAEISLAIDGDRLALRSGDTPGLRVSIGADAFSDLLQDVVSTAWLTTTQRVDIRRGTVTDFVRWEPVLRHLLDGTPVFQSGSIEFRDRHGAALDINRSFTLEDDPADLGHFLEEAGFLHIAGVFTSREMAAVSDELDAAIADSHPEDGQSWWARTASGQQYPARILAFNEKSPTLRELLNDDRFMDIARLTDDQWIPPNPDRGDAAGGLLKKIGVVEGISDLAWHKDCASGNHSRNCANLVVGVSVTGSGPESGEIGVVAGSHRANVSPVHIDDIDLPHRALPTRTGDLTIHCSCTLHMSRPPRTAERRVVYSAFNLPPREHDAPAEPIRDRRERLAQNDHVRRWQRMQSSAATEK